MGSNRKLLKEQFPDMKVSLTDGYAREVMAAADVLLIASGTATLEAALLKKPMLVCYKMSGLSYALISRMLKVPYFSLPNLLAGIALVEERVQHEVNASALFESVQHLMDDKEKQKQLSADYLKIHHTLRQKCECISG